MTSPLRRPPLVQAICDHLLHEHRSEEWLPSERKLATQLGVSRPALREAIKRLENQGLLASRHGIGVQVVNEPHAPIQAVFERALPLPAERIRQFTAVRLLIEPAMAAIAAHRIRPTEAKRLRSLHDAFLSAVDVAAAVAADLEFHHLISHLGGNQVLELMMASMAPLEIDSRHTTLGRVGLEVARAQHGAILHAIVSHNSEAARDAMQAHLCAAESSLGSRRSASSA